MIQFLLNKANESPNTETIQTSVRRNASARRLFKTENPDYRTSTRYSGFGQSLQKRKSWRDSMPPQDDDAGALEDPFIDFPPYDSIWEKTFLVYKWHGESFCLEEWPTILKQLTALHTDGLSVRHHFQDPSKCDLASSNLSAPTLEAHVEEKDENTPAIGLQLEALKLQQLLLQNQICVSETDISECLEEASRISADCFKLRSIDKDADFNLEPFGDFSAVLKEASLIVDGRLSADALAMVLKTLLAQSRAAPDKVCMLGARTTSLFTQHIVTSMESLVKKRLKQLELLAFKDPEAEDHALLNLIEKVIYLCLRNGYHFSQASRHLLHSFAKKVWAETKNVRFEELFSNNYPFLVFKLIVWDNMDKYFSNQFFTMGILSKLFRPFKTSLRAVILLSKTPIFECLEVIAMISCRKKKRRGRFEHDDIDFIHRLCLKMLFEGMQSEPMDDNSFAYSMMEYECGTSTPKQSPLTTGPISLALSHEVGEFLCLHRPQEILEIVWCGELYNLLCRRTKPLLYSSLGQVWSSDNLFLNATHHTHYKTCPCYVGLLDFLAWATLLGCVYCTIFLATDSQKYGYKVEMFTYHYLLFSLVIVFSLNELRLFMQNGIWVHFESLWNIQDAVIIMIVVVFAICCVSDHIHNLYAYHALTIVSILVLFRTLYFATIFRSYGMLVSALFIMMGDVLKFILLFLIILAGFAAVMVSFFPDCEQFQSFGAAATNLFSAGLAAFDYGWFDGTDNPTGGVIILTIYVMIANVILLNMLIAILADSYSSMTEVRNQSSAVARAKFIQEYEDLPVPLNSIYFVCTLLSSVLKGKMKLWWDSGCLKLYFVVEFLMTLFVIGPFLCIMDCWYIGYIFTYSISTKVKNYSVDECQAVHEKSSQSEDATFSQVVKLLRNVAEIVCATLYFIAMLFVFVALYFGRLAYNMMVWTYQIPSNQTQCTGREGSFQHSEPGSGPEHYLRSLKEAMVKVFHFDDDDTDDLLLELDDKVRNVMLKVDDLRSENTVMLQELKEQLTNEFSQNVQRLTEKMERMEKVNRKILALIEIKHTAQINKNQAKGNIFDCPR